MKPIATLIFLRMFLSPVCVAEDAFPLKAKRILFLGDSITAAGEFVNMIEMQLRLQSVDPMPELVNAGLPSEGCTGLSEPDHPFPRPDVHERLDRALAAVKPDVVVACYGMNDGIYYPFSQERFQKYAAWILEQKDRVEMVIDLHTPITAFWVQQRKQDPAFTVAPDGVHCNSACHQTIAEVILKAWGVESWMPISDHMTQLSN